MSDEQPHALFAGRFDACAQKFFQLLTLCCLGTRRRAVLQFYRFSYS
jgi:hypothetical protein